MRNKVFVDADAFVALIREDDNNHEKALSFLDRLEQDSTFFVTSNYVFSEVITVLSLRMGHEAAVAFIDTMKSPTSKYAILRVDEDLEDKAIEIFKSQSSKNVSFVDCTNISIVQDHKIEMILSFDKIYRKNGLQMVTDKNN